MNLELSPNEAEFFKRNRHLIPTDTMMDGCRLVYDIGCNSYGIHYGPYLYQSGRCFLIPNHMSVRSTPPARLLHDHIVANMRVGDTVTLQGRKYQTTYTVLYLHPTDGKVLLRHMDNLPRHGWHVVKLDYYGSCHFSGADF